MRDRGREGKVRERGKGGEKGGRKRGRKWNGERGVGAT